MKNKPTDNLKFGTQTDRKNLKPDKMPVQKMKRTLYLQAFVVWIMLAALTVLFGAFREAFFIPATGMNPVASRAVLLPVPLAYLFVITLFFLKRTKTPHSSKQALLIGVMWLLLTVLFEFAFGSLVMGNTLQMLIADYNIFNGRIWPLFLLWVLLCPFMVSGLLHRKRYRV